MFQRLKAAASLLRHRNRHKEIVEKCLDVLRPHFALHQPAQALKNEFILAVRVASFRSTWR